MDAPTNAANQCRLRCPGTGQPRFPLTRRELQVLQLVVDGRSNREIAERLRIGFETVKEHVQQLIGRLRVHNRSEAAIVARLSGIA